MSAGTYNMDPKCCLFILCIALIQCLDAQVCPSGYILNNGKCEALIQCLDAHVCPSGYILNNGKCEDVNECDVLNGRCQQSCVNSVGSYKCECQIGYQLANDNHRCDDFDECSLNNGDCQSGQVCVNTWGGKYCSGSNPSVTLKPEALDQIGEKLLKFDVVIGLIAWLVVVTVLVLLTIAVMVRQTPNRREQSLIKGAESSGKNPDYFFPEFWPHVSVTNRSRQDPSDVKY